MKNKNILVFCTFALTVTLAAWVVVDVTKKHAQSATGHSLAFGTHKASTETTDNNTTHDATSHEDNTQSETTATPQETAVATINDNASDVKKEEPTVAEEFKDIDLFQYTVQENDTVWKIAKTFMPDYNAHPKDGKSGVIAYIVKENKLEQLADDTYHIFTGQKLTIPKQKNVAINTSTKSTTPVKTATVAKKTETTKATTKSTTSSNTTSVNTTATTSTNTANSTTVDHSAHTAH